MEHTSCNEPITQWLRSIRLSEYAPVFEENGVTNLAELASVSNETLKTIGIQRMGHRKRILKCIGKTVLPGSRKSNAVETGPGALICPSSYNNVEDTTRTMTSSSCHEKQQIESCKDNVDVAVTQGNCENLHHLGDSELQDCSGRKEYFVKSRETVHSPRCDPVQVSKPVPKPRTRFLKEKTNTSPTSDNGGQAKCALDDDQKVKWIVEDSDRLLVARIACEEVSEDPIISNSTCCNQIPWTKINCELGDSTLSRVNLLPPLPPRANIGQPPNKFSLGLADQKPNIFHPPFATPYQGRSKCADIPENSTQFVAPDGSFYHIKDVNTRPDIGVDYEGRQGKDDDLSVPGKGRLVTTTSLATPDCVRGMGTPTPFPSYHVNSILQDFLFTSAGSSETNIDVPNQVAGMPLTAFHQAPTAYLGKSEDVALLPQLSPSIKDPAPSANCDTTSEEWTTMKQHHELASEVQTTLGDPEATPDIEPDTLVFTIHEEQDDTVHSSNKEPQTVHKIFWEGSRNDCVFVEQDGLNSRSGSNLSLLDPTIRSPSHLSFRGDALSLLSLSSEDFPSSPVPQSDLPSVFKEHDNSVSWNTDSQFCDPSEIPSNKAGWLEKQPPVTGYRFQRRWVKFDGEYLAYYNNEKEVYSKGIIPLWTINNVEASHSDTKFDVRTPNRTFTFRADSDGVKWEWVAILHKALQDRLAANLPVGLSVVEKHGTLELKGCRRPLYLAVSGERLWLYKSFQDFQVRVGITMIEMNVAMVKDLDRRTFELTTPYKTFSFTAETDKEKQEWMEALREATSEALSNSEVAERIWSNDSNRTCADCGAANPAWSSINLCVVICKMCAGQHRALGPNISKVRSLKMDRKIWTENLIELLCSIGNDGANAFWVANMPDSERLAPNACSDKRSQFIVSKYREGKYRRFHVLYGIPNDLRQALCASVMTSDLLETMALVFCGADLSELPEDPLKLAEQAGQQLQLQFLQHNRHLDWLRAHEVKAPGLAGQSFPSCAGTLYKTPSSSKAVLDRKGRDDFCRRRCVLEAGILSYFEGERNVQPSGRIDMRDVCCLGVTRPGSLNQHGFEFTMELCCVGESERVYLFGTNKEDIFREWTLKLAQSFVPQNVAAQLHRHLDRVGRLRYKDGYACEAWRLGWFMLEGSQLHFCPPEPTAELEHINLHKLQELALGSPVENNGRKEVLILSEKRRTLYVQGCGRIDFCSWHTALRQAAASHGRSLARQHLTDEDVPIAADKCIDFVTRNGLISEGIYRKAGVSSRVTALLADFWDDARAVRLRDGATQVDDVASVLKRFLRELDGCLFTYSSREAWAKVAALPNEDTKVPKYRSLLQSMPHVNVATLTALIGHLYFIQVYSSLNQMNAYNLSIVFTPSLFHSNGDNSDEARVVEDLITDYVSIFDVKEEQLKLRQQEMDYIIRLHNDTGVNKRVPAGDLILEVYLRKKENDCGLTLKVSALMTAEELVAEVLSLRSQPVTEWEQWAVFEVSCNGELERVLHYRERVLDAVLQWRSTVDYQSNYLIVRHHAAQSYLQKSFTAQTLENQNGLLKYREESGKLSELLSVTRFQEKYFVLCSGKLLMHKDTKTNRVEKEWSINKVRVYLGVKKRVKPPTIFGFTMIQAKHQWYFCCKDEQEVLEWYSGILYLQHNGDLWPPKRPLPCEVEHVPQNIGGRALIPLRGDVQTLRNMMSHQTKGGHVISQRTK
uniref:arf-GAP with Rho-GAP domain, ANK repeat and PH domain-containing protein 1-like isoform X2 n=1 Tax=Myxine glutinosa TaxID=7769 RepID=UPI00358F77D3